MVRTSRAIRYGLAALLVLAVTAELTARHYGLHRPVLYEPTSYGYRVAPNQDLSRLGRRTFYNEYGLRSEPMTLEPKPGVLRVLCIGDSITNGGTITDQASSYPYLLEALLRDKGLRAEVLNASAGGWALENAEGWLRENGTFGAHLVVIEVATHDLFQPAAEASVVGGHPSFPSRPPLLALEDLLRRHLLPRLSRVLTPGDPGAEWPQRDIGAARAGIDRVAAMAQKVRADGATPLVLQVGQPGSLEPRDAVTEAAKRDLMTTLVALRVPIIETRDEIAMGGGTNLFRDALHPNPEGNRVLAETVARALLKVISFPP